MCQAEALLSVLQEAKISLLNNMNCVITNVFLTVLCVALMMHNDGFEAYYLFTFSDIHKCKMLGNVQNY